MYWFAPNGPQTVPQQIENLRQYSRYRVDAVNVHGTPWRKTSLRRYDGLILHSTTTYTLAAVPEYRRFFDGPLETFGGFKVMMKQDEMRRVDETNRFIRDFGVNLVTTCLPESEIPKVYGPNVDGTRFLRTYTGYVTDEMRTYSPVPLDRRTKDVVYRGMPSPFEWGRLGREKFEISAKFRQAAEPFRLNVDVSSEWADRLGGDSWIQLLASSRAALATESGASVFDFDGSIEAECQRLRTESPSVTFEEVHDRLLAPHEGKIVYNQISPRHLEAAYTRTLQVLYEGTYSGLLEPGRDYVSLKKDFSNIEEVVRSVRDDATVKRLTENCYRTLIDDERLHYRGFVARLDAAMGEL